MGGLLHDIPRGGFLPLKHRAKEHGLHSDGNGGPFNRCFAQVNYLCETSIKRTWATQRRQWWAIQFQFDCNGWAEFNFCFELKEFSLIIVSKQMSQTIEEQRATCGKHRGWCFSIEKWDEADYLRIQLLQMSANVRYIIYTTALGDDDGSKHIKGYVYFCSPMSKRSVGRKIPNAKIIPVVNSIAKGREYWTRFGDYVEYGQPIKQGKRTDLDSIRSALTLIC